MSELDFDCATCSVVTEIGNGLIVPKCRCGAALEEPLKLKLTDAVAVDTSRDIA